MSKADLILHPVRMRILMALTGRVLTAKELATLLPDVAQATLYRHINALADGGVLTIVEENPVRGTVEKVYTVEGQAARLTSDDMANMSKDEHMQMFTVFITTVLQDFAAYMDGRETVDLFADRVSYGKFPLYLSDDELQEISNVIQASILPHINNQPDGKRKRRILTSIIVPDETGEG
jgi:DNA-binding transcriptional ArsR family regulator